MDKNYPLNKLMEKICKVEFALDEVNLYLDVYPNCREALAYYHKLMAVREKLVAEYEMKSPITHYGNRSTTSWDWIESPWPWQYDAN